MNKRIESSKIIRFPVSSFQRRKNSMGPGYVPCYVSERWLQFPKDSSVVVREGELMFVDVMSIKQRNDEPHRLCTLCISREDLEKALADVKPKEA